MNTFKNYHPLVNFIYFLSVIGFGMLFMHPVCLGISLFGSLVYSMRLKGKKALVIQLVYMLPLMLVTAAVNPLFNHEGATILGYFKDGNPFTLESVYYGMAAAAMLVSVISWFSCYNEVMTSDKFIYLFGKILPSLSLLLSMTLSFVPKLKSQLKVIISAQTGIGRDPSTGSLAKRIKCGLVILSILMTWAFEQAIHTADSMKSRGYGLPGRTAFSIFQWTKRDKVSLGFIVAMTLYILCGYCRQIMSFRYFPTLKGAAGSAYGISVFGAYFLLAITPVMIEVWEEQRWKLTRFNS